MIKFIQNEYHKHSCRILLYGATPEIITSEVNVSLTQFSISFQLKSSDTTSLTITNRCPEDPHPHCLIEGWLFFINESARIPADSVGFFVCGGGFSKTFFANNFFPMRYITFISKNGFQFLKETDFFPEKDQDTQREELVLFQLMSSSVICGQRGREQNGGHATSKILEQIHFTPCHLYSRESIIWIQKKKS